jgi:hypothetical protein
MNDWIDGVWWSIFGDLYSVECDATESQSPALICRTLQKETQWTMQGDVLDDAVGDY